MPTLRQMAAFRIRATLPQTRRAAVDLLGPRVTRHPSGRAMATETVIAEARVPLRTDVPASERGLVAGKIQNLRVALRRLDGVEVPAGEVFSFWAQLGRATRSKGAALAIDAGL